MRAGQASYDYFGLSGRACECRSSWGRARTGWRLPARRSAKRLRPPRRRLPELRGPQRRSGRLRRALRARRALPRLELLLSAHGECGRDLLAEERGAAARRGQMLRVGRARRRRDRAAQGADRIFHRPARRRLSQFRMSRPIRPARPARRPARRENKCRAWTYVRPGYIGPARALLSQGQDHAAAAQAVLHFGRGAVARCSAPR